MIQVTMYKTNNTGNLRVLVDTFVGTSQEEALDKAAVETESINQPLVAIDHDTGQEWEWDGFEWEEL